MAAETASPNTLFTKAEWRALRVLRASYSSTGDLWSEKELERLRFVRWLYRVGRLVS